MEKLTLTYLKKEFYLDGFLEMLKKKVLKKQLNNFLQKQGMPEKIKLLITF